MPPLAAHIDARQDIRGIPDLIFRRGKEVMPALVIAMAAARYGVYCQWHIFHVVVEQAFEVRRSVYFLFAVDVDRDQGSGQATEVPCPAVVHPLAHDRRVPRPGLGSPLKTRVFPGIAAFWLAAFTFKTAARGPDPVERDERNERNGQECVLEAGFV
jgi:hypothetical protein